MAKRENSSRRVGNSTWMLLATAATLLMTTSVSANSIDQASHPLGITGNESLPQVFEKEVSPKPGSPNVVYIVLDDVGFSDLHSFGSEINTPNMDALAANGLRYNNFNTKAICSPTRAALLTGRNSQTVGMSNVANMVNGFPNGQGRITPHAETVAEALQAAGYRTYAIGKWHLNSDIEGSIRAQWPLGRGFDQYYGFLEGMTDQYEPSLVQDNTPVDVPDRKNYHLSEDLVDHAISYIGTETAVSPERPFFLYLAFGAAHAPHQVPLRYIDKYVPIFTKGWDQTRTDRLARQKALGIAPSNAELPAPNPGIKRWSELSPDEKTVAIRFQATYAGFLEHTDDQIGRLIAFLKSSGRLDNTIIVLLSDNGGSKEGDYEGTINELASLTQRHDSMASLLPKIQEFGQANTSQNYPMGWTQASNTPFRFYKTTNWSGGIRTPFIIDVPGKIRDTGKIRGQFIDAIDVTPTILDLVGVSMSETYKGIPQLPVAGRSFAETLTDADAPPPRDTQYFELMAQRAIWHDGWRAVAVHKPGTSFTSDVWQLYNDRSDFSQVHDLSAVHPDVLAEMKNRWWAEAGKYGALPLVDAPLVDAFTPGKGPGGLQLTTRLKVRRDGRPDYRFFPGEETLSMQEAPVLSGPGYRFTVSTAPLTGNEEGVLFSDGDQFGGYSLFTRSGRLVFTYNDLGNPSSVSANVPLKGVTSIAYDFERTSYAGGIGKLFVDGKMVASSPIRQPDTFLTALSGFDVGRDSGGHAAPDYADRGMFAFPAHTIQEVKLHVEGAAAKASSETSWR